MPIDPRIPLGVQAPQIPSPLDLLQQVSQLQEQRAQADARQTAAQDAQAKRARQAQVDAAYEKAVKVDPQTGRVTVDRSVLLGGLPGSLVPSVMKELDADEQSIVNLQTATLNLHKAKQGHLGSAAQTVLAAQGDPTIWGVELRGAHELQLLDDEAYERLRAIDDPAQIRAIAQSFVTRAGGEAAKTPAAGSFEDYVTRVARQQGVDVAALTPEALVAAKSAFEAAGRAPAAAPSPPNVGSFEDYVVRRFGPTPSPDQITEARKAYQQADDRPPSITVNAGGQRPITQTAEAGLITRLNTQWTTASKPARELAQQVTTMRAGVAAAERGDMAQGTEAVLQPFLKILDPNSVVREGEFFRLREGQSYLARARGIMQRLTQGGFVPLAELKKYAALAEEIATRQDAYVAGVRGRIGQVADRYNIPQELVFESVAPDADTRTTPPAGGSAPGLSYQDYLNRKK